MTTKTKSRYKKSFTVEQNHAYKDKKESEKLKIQDLYTKFLTKKTIQDFIEIIAQYKLLHNYSIHNRIRAISQAEQRGYEEFVGQLNSFHNWKTQDIQILKGSKSFQILVPIFRKPKDQEQKTSQSEEEKEKKILSHFKLGNVFDLSQTSEYQNYLQEKSQIDEKIMANGEIDYDIALNFIKEHFFNVPIREDFKPQAKKGSYNPHTRQITLHQKSSNSLFHEIGHYITIHLLKIAGDIREKYAKNEILAEVSAYLLMKTFDENINYNFAYNNCWSTKITDTFEIEEFEKDFTCIMHYLEKFQPPKTEGEQTNGM